MRIRSTHTTSNIKPHMTTKDDGGPIAPNMEPGNGGGLMAIGGLSIRDYFAAMALAGLPIPAYDMETIDPKQFASDAYAVADAMLAARKEDA